MRLQLGQREKQAPGSSLSLSPFTGIATVLPVPPKLRQDRYTTSCQETRPLGLHVPKERFEAARGYNLPAQPQTGFPEPKIAVGQRCPGHPPRPACFRLGPGPSGGCASLC